MGVVKSRPNSLMVNSADASSPTSNHFATISFWDANTSLLIPRNAFAVAWTSCISEAAGTIDALFAALCLSKDLTILTTDRDFHRIADILPLSCWRSKGTG